MNELNTKKEPTRSTELIKSTEEKYLTISPRPDARPQDRAYLAWYRGLIAEIGAQVKRLGISDLNALDSLFRGVYIPFTLRYGVTPKLIDFCAFVGVEYSSLINTINNSNNHLYKSIIESWLLLCKEYLISNLIDESGSNVNNIFVLKAVYGLTDNPQTKTDNAPTRILKDRSQIIAELTAGDVENSPDPGYSS